jgi:putative CocE/NonD family hydrolase
MRPNKPFLGFFFFLLLAVTVNAGQDRLGKRYTLDDYVRSDHLISMRDGVRLYTIVYAPKDRSQKFPLLMTRTPYGIGPYEKTQKRGNLGPNHSFLEEGYIFVYQDVRGRYLSEGHFENMRPHLPRHKSVLDIDESTDTYDTIDWLIKNVPNNNGKAGMWGISYPGFYCSAGMIDAHPSLKAVSPQAPIADWYFDDFYHHGAFFLPHAFWFFSSFGKPRPEPTTMRTSGFDFRDPDGYKFYLQFGSLKNVNERYFKKNIAFWNRFVEHPNYDEFWQARNLLPHLKKVAPAVMTVGGWYDAEDLYGPLKTYRAIEEQNPGITNILVMGPWRHGGWSGGAGAALGNIHFGSNTGDFYRQNIELPFFNFHLKGGGDPKLPEAYVFETGANRWRKFDRWPPKQVETKKLYLHSGGKLSFDLPGGKGEAFDAYISDPNRPVPFTEAISYRMTVEYMTDDQRFASKRPDVVVYQTEELREDVTLAGHLLANLYVSTSGTDSDWIVKLIDVFPDDARDFSEINMTRPLAGYQMMVRSEIIRGRFRESYSQPKAFVPNQPANVKLELQDVLHTYKKGHRIMVQIHSSWFPLADRNPQKFVPNIFLAEEADFVSATQRVYRSEEYPTHVQVGVLK